MTVVVENKEKELVEHLLSKDIKRFCFVYDYFSSSLYGLINKIVKHDELAEDILQEVFLKIWNGSSQYDPKKSRLFTWMLNIARNTSIDYLRSKQGKIDKKSNSTEAIPGIYEKAENNSVNHDHLGLKKVIENLRIEQKEIIDLAFFEGYTQSEIAEKLQMPLGTVKTRYRSALIVLRKNLNDFN